MAPVVLTVEFCAIVAAVVVNEAKAVVAPMVDEKVTVPVPALAFNANAPLTVLPNVKLALLLVSVLAPVKVKGTVKFNGLVPSTAKLLAKLIPLALEIIKLEMGVVPPTAPVNVVAAVPESIVKG